MIWVKTLRMAALPLGGFHGNVVVHRILGEAVDDGLHVDAIEGFDQFQNQIPRFAHLFHLPLLLIDEFAVFPPRFRKAAQPPAAGAGGFHALGRRLLNTLSDGPGRGRNRGSAPTCRWRRRPCVPLASLGARPANALRRSVAKSGLSPSSSRDCPSIQRDQASGWLQRSL